MTENVFDMGPGTRNQGHFQPQNLCHEQNFADFKRGLAVFKLRDKAVADIGQRGQLTLPQGPAVCVAPG